MKLADMHANAVKREVEDGRMIPTKSFESIEQINLDMFDIKFNGGITNVAEIVKIRDFIDDALTGISDTIDLFMRFHKDSPIKNWDELVKEDSAYTIGLSLDRFLIDESGNNEYEDPFYRMNNYALAEKVLEAFEAAGNKIKGIEDISFRETAMWQIKSKATAKKFSKFIYDTYISPLIEERINIFNIKKVNFDEEQITFDYKK